MEGLGVVLVVLYAVFSLVSRGMAKDGREARDDESRRRARALARERAERLRRTGVLTPDQGTSATQVEARGLEELLRGLGGVLRLPDKGVAGPPAEAAEPEEAYSLEGTSIEGESRDVQPVRPARAPFSADEVASAVVQRRIDAAAARSGALGPADHAAFHRRLAATAPALQVTRPPVRGELGGRSRAELRRAVVWREILGEPVALRRGEER